jgi:hypothetical protein
MEAASGTTSSCAASLTVVSGPTNAAHAYYYLLPVSSNKITTLITSKTVVPDIDFYATSIDTGSAGYPPAVAGEPGHVDGIYWLNAFFPGSSEIAQAPVQFETSSTTVASVPASRKSAYGVAPWSTNPAYWGLCYDASFNAPSTGNYTFSSYVDDYTALWIDGNLVYDDNYGNKSTSITTAPGTIGWMPVSSTVSLTAGTHTVMIEYEQTSPVDEGLQYFVQYPGTDSPVIMPLGPMPAGTSYSCPH